MTRPVVMMTASWIKPQRRPIQSPRTPTRIWPALGQHHLSPSVEINERTLTNNDTANFEILDGLDPSFVAGFVVLPTIGKDGLEKGREVADGKQDVSRTILSGRRGMLVSVQAYPSSKRPAPGMTIFLK